MSVLLGLPIDGEPITGYADVDIFDYCGQYLGQLPEAKDVVGNRLSLRWLQETFDLCHLREESNVIEAKVQWYARTTILRLIGGDIFSDKTVRLVHSMFIQFVTNLRNIRQYS